MNVSPSARKFQTRGDRFVASFEEIARELGSSRQAVEYTYRAALRKLRLSPSLRWLWEAAVEEPRTPPRKLGVLSWDIAERLPPARPTERYPDWNDITTRVVSGPIGAATFRGQRFTTHWAAREHWIRRSRIYQDHTLPGRWIFRVRRDA